MTKIRVLVLLILSGINAKAQKNHFIAVQSENKQSFYAKTGAVVLNSTSTGHLIIPKLIDSTYIITIGFSKTKIEEQFSITITKDIGFILRVGKDNRLFLSNSQTAQMITPIKQQQYFVSADSATTPSTTLTKKPDPSFARLMSEVVNDSAVMENMSVADEPKKEEPQKELVKTEKPSKALAVTDSSSVVNKSKKKNEDTLGKKVAVIKTPEKNEKLVRPSAQKPQINKLSQQKNDSVLELVYEDVNKSGKRDTINIAIPFDSVANNALSFPKDNGKTTVAETKHDVRTDSLNKPKLQPDEKTSVVKSQAPILKKDSSVADTTRTPLFRPITTNISCKNTATDYDVDKLRVKMLAIEDEDDKISTAKKVFKAKCFSVNQIRALSEIFPNDAGKYKLFDAAYSYVLDTNNFTSLQSLLKDDYYIVRFKAMIK